MSKPLNLIKWVAAAGLAWGLGYAYNVYYGGDLSWLRIMYTEKVALAKKVEGPRRLIITGGSGAHYTINSELLEKELGLPVFNLGIDGPVGLDVILPSVLKQVQPGDIVLLIPEYLIILDEDGLGDRSGPFMIATGQLGITDIPPKQLAQDIWMQGIPSLRALTKSSFDLVKKGRFTGYYSDPITKRGDPTVVKERTGEWWKMQFKKSISPHAIKRIKKFRKELEAKDADLVLSLPWVYAKTDNKTLKNVKKTAAELEKIAPLIYNPENYNVQSDPDLFADTHYHLKLDSMKVRSRQIVEEIEPILEELGNGEQETGNGEGDK